MLGLIQAVRHGPLAGEDLAESGGTGGGGVPPGHHRFAHVGVDDQHPLAQLRQAFAQLEGHRGLALVFVAAGDHHRADILPAELQIGPQRLEGLLGEEIVSPRQL